MSAPLSIFWFRRDLRLEDNAGLFYALSESETVLPLFIFDKNILDPLNPFDRRVDFIHQALSAINQKLQSFSSSLLVEHDIPERVFLRLVKDYQIKTVYCNHDYEPYAIERDEKIRSMLEEKKIGFKTFKDQCVFEKNEICKDDGSPYTVFTPYSRKWKQLLRPEHYKQFLSLDLCAEKMQKGITFPLPSLEEIGFEKTELRFRKPSLENDLLINYKLRRDFPAIQGTSRLSMHLRFGTISVRQHISRAITYSEAWLNELIWRDFYMSILWHFPYVVTKAFKKNYDKIAWRNNEVEFRKWCEGKTGFPIVDAGMRELNATGFMHNRVRMITSSFLVKDLLIDWRWGEAYFAEKLNDFDLSANNGGWQWAAGSGCDAVPYFRIFNPAEQQKKFDPELKYIKKWIPEYGSDKYPPPMLDHAEARKRAISVFKEALSQS